MWVYVAKNIELTFPTKKTAIKLTFMCQSQLTETSTHTFLTQKPKFNIHHDKEQCHSMWDNTDIEAQ